MPLNYCCYVFTHTQLTKRKASRNYIKPLVLTYFEFDLCLFFSNSASLLVYMRECFMLNVLNVLYLQYKGNCCSVKICMCYCTDSRLPAVRFSLVSVSQ